MRKNAITVGDKTFEGDYNRILGAGDINIFNSDIKKLYVAGDMSIRNSKIKKLRVAGEIKIHESTLTDSKLVGDIVLTGICKADTFIVTGEINAQNLECRLLKENKVKDGDFNKNLNWSGYFKAETFENFHDLIVSFDYDFKNIISTGLLVCENEITCDNFYSFGGVQAPLINAENITVLLNENIKLEGIVGTNIVVKSNFTPDNNFKDIPKTADYKSYAVSRKIVTIPQLEGDYISLEYTKSNLVSGNDVIIGDLCIIEKVEYKNSIKISEKAIVNEVVKL